MSCYSNIRQDSDFVYGKLYELLELLNNNNLRFYVKNENRLDLSRYFKYPPKKMLEFVGIFDYFANCDEKESEFVVFPIIFNDNYEILHIGVSVFFKENFYDDYKNGNYNYLELYIRNVAKSNSCIKHPANTNGTDGICKKLVDDYDDDDDDDDDDIRVNCDVLISLKELKKLNDQEQIRNGNELGYNGNEEICKKSPYNFKGSDILLKNSNIYSEDKERRRRQLGIYKDEYEYKKDLQSYNINSFMNNTSGINGLLYPFNFTYNRGNILNPREQNMLLGETNVNLNNEISTLNDIDLHHHRGFCSSTKEGYLQRGNVKMFNSYFKHAEIKDDIQNGRIMCNTKFFQDSIDAGIMGHVMEDSNKKEKEKSNFFISGFHSSKGNRTYNEDRVINIDNVNEFLKKEMEELKKKKENNEEYDKKYEEFLIKATAKEVPSYAYSAIYDGHNGENAVNIAQKYLHLNIHLYILNGNGINNSIKLGFKAIDSQICEETSNCEEDNHSNYSSGTTACVTIIFKSVIYIGNIGDSRCVLSKNGRAVVLTVDHRVSVNKKEQDRILNSGGTLDDEGYLGGCLGVCRGFGSFEKQTRIKLKGLICDPDIFQVKLTDDDEFLIICCDGIFDVMTSQEAVNTVRMSLIQNANANIAAEALCDLAYTRKSLDNLSAVVVVFQNPANKKIAVANEGVCLNSSQSGRVRRKIKFSALKNLLDL